MSSGMFWDLTEALFTDLALWVQWGCCYTGARSNMRCAWLGRGRSTGRTALPRSSPWTATRGPRWRSRCIPCRCPLHSSVGFRMHISPVDRHWPLRDRTYSTFRMLILTLHWSYLSTRLTMMSTFYLLLVAAWQDKSLTPMHGLHAYLPLSMSNLLSDLHNTKRSNESQILYSIDYKWNVYPFS